MSAIPPVPPDDQAGQPDDWPTKRYETLLKDWADAQAAERTGAAATQTAELEEGKAGADQARSLASVVETAELEEAKAAATQARTLESAVQTAELEEGKAVSTQARSLESAVQTAAIEETKAAATQVRTVESAAQTADVALEKAEFDLDYELLKNFHAAMVETAKGAFERSKTAADFVQAAAVAISTLYTGILAFVSAGDDKTLPARGLIPVVFLGAAIALAAGYRGFLGSTGTVDANFGSGSRRATQLARSTFLVNWANQAVLARAPFLRGAVVALGIGAAFLPIGVVETAAIDVLAWRWAFVVAYGLLWVLLWEVVLKRAVMLHKWLAVKLAPRSAAVVTLVVGGMPWLVALGLLIVGGDRVSEQAGLLFHG